MSYSGFLNPNNTGGHRTGLQTAILAGLRMLFDQTKAFEQCLGGLIPKRRLALQTTHEDQVFDAAWA